MSQHAGILDFVVREYPLYIHSMDNTNELSVPTHKALVRSIDKRPYVLGVVGKGYNVVQNGELFDEVGKHINANDHCEITDCVSNVGAYSQREYFFKDKQAEIEQIVPERGIHQFIKTTVAFRIVVVNTFDGSSAVRVSTGSVDRYCLNKAVIGEFDQLSIRHNNKLILPKFEERIEAATVMFSKQADIWRSWARKVITHDAAQQVVNKLDISDKQKERIVQRYIDHELPHRGANIYALYSAMTYLDTYMPVRNTVNDHAARTLMLRERGTRALVYNDVWKEFADHVREAA